MNNILSTQSVFVYAVLIAAVIYLVYRGYISFLKKKTSGCAKCAANEKT